MWLREDARILVLFTQLVAACATAPPPPLAQAGQSLSTPPNLSALKAELTVYHDDGRYEAGLAQLAGEAMVWLEERAARGGRLAVVFDIDETALTNWPAIRANDFGTILEGPCSLDPGPCGLYAWIERAEIPPIAPSLALFRRARHLGVDVFFITARLEPMRAATERNLRAVGYDGWTGLYLKPDDTSSSTASFKTAQRREIEAQGYTIILNIGDQLSDLEGGYSERTFLLPNPFYRG